MQERIKKTLSTVSVFGLLIVLAVSLAAIGIEISARRRTEHKMAAAVTQSEIVVQRGDTLWAISKAQFPQEDPRRVIEEILQLNRLDSARIYPGQVLNIPERQNYPKLQLASELGK